MNTELNNSADLKNNKLISSDSEDIFDNNTVLAMQSGPTHSKTGDVLIKWTIKNKKIIKLLMLKRLIRIINIILEQ